ncbi:DUF1655 domain-containing protein [Lactococcus formosensis]|nr:DUF1655 domain-containing protein [Lactococcus formosensis]MDG6166573.1 DUF1655 domain-containing protein [Lactococcus formosensis]MDG6171654.1 DUF1655 domain-containing protein [Lactococcus formosensis]
MLEIQDFYSFDIYNYQSETAPSLYSYLLVLHRDNGTALRKTLSKIFTSQDSRTIFIVADQYASKGLSRIKQRNDNRGVSIMTQFINVDDNTDKLFDGRTIVTFTFLGDCYQVEYIGGVKA